jgi:hypothetical protein
MEPNQDVTKNNSFSFYSYNDEHPHNHFFNPKDEEAPFYGYEEGYDDLFTEAAVDDRVIRASWSGFDRARRFLTLENEKKLCQSPAFRARFKLPKRFNRNVIFYTESLTVEKTSTLNRVIYKQADINEININPVKKSEKVTPTTDWLDMALPALKGEQCPAKEEIEKKWKEFEAYLDVLEADRESWEFSEWLEALKAIDDPLVEQFAEISFSPKNYTDVRNFRIACLILQKGYEEASERQFSFAFQACVLLPIPYRNDVWSLMRHYLTKVEAHGVDLIIKNLLLSNLYTFDSFLDSFQIMAGIALAHPEAEGDQIKCRLAGQAPERFIQLRSQNGTYLIPHTLINPSELFARIDKQNDVPEALRLKTLLTYVLPNLKPTVDCKAMYQAQYRQLKGNQCTRWLDLTSECLKGEHLPTQKEIDENWNDFILYLKSFSGKSEIKDLITAIAHEILEKMQLEQPKHQFRFAFQACVNIPLPYRDAVWQEMNRDLHDPHPKSVEYTLKKLLEASNYSFDETLAILQTLGGIALGTPSVQGKNTLKLIGPANDRRLRLRTQDSHFVLPFNLQNPAELAQKAQSWKLRAPVHFQLKNLLEHLLPNLSSKAPVCPEFKAIYDSQYSQLKNNNWIRAGFELLRSQNSFLVTVGYRLIFVERALSSRPFLNEPRLYLGNLPIALATLPVQAAEKKRDFYHQFCQCAGGSKLSSHLNQLMERVNWPSATVGEIQASYLDLLAESSEEFMRAAAWDLWLGLTYKKALLSSWKRSLQNLLKTRMDTEKESLGRICDVLKSHAEEKTLVPADLNEMYAILIPYAEGNREVQVRMAEDAYSIYSSMPREIIGDKSTIQLFVSLIKPLTKVEHLALLTKILNLLLNHMETVASTELADIILRVCYLVQETNPDYAYELWKRICNRYRRDDNPPDMDFIIGVARRMYRTLITSKTPQPDFAKLVQILQKSRTTKLSANELKKYHLVISKKITRDDLAVASEIVKETTNESHDLSFFLKCRVFRLRLQEFTSGAQLETLLADFNILVNEACSLADHIEVGKIFHLYFETACSDKLYNIIVINRLVNSSICKTNYGSTYHKIMNALLGAFQRKEQDGPYLLEYLASAIAVALRAGCTVAAADIANTFLKINKRVEHFDAKLQELLRSGAEWLCLELCSHPIDLQRAFLELIVEQISGGLKNPFLSTLPKVLKGLLTHHYDEATLKLFNVMRTKQFLGLLNPQDHLSLIETLLDQWTKHISVPCDASGWVDHFCAQNGAPKYAAHHQEHVMSWIGMLLNTGDHKSACKLLKLLGQETHLRLWNRLLDASIAAKDYLFWMATILDNPSVFKDSSCIDEYNVRAPAAIASLMKVPKEKAATYSQVLQMAERYPITAAAWVPILNQLHSFNNPTLKQTVVRIVTAPGFSTDVFSNCVQHGIACWGKVSVFLGDVDTFDRKWLLGLDLLEKPFVNTLAVDPVPFLIGFLALHLRIPKAESQESMKFRLSRAFEVRDRIKRSRDTIHPKHRPQMISLIDQAVKSKDFVLYMKSCRLALECLKDKETASQAARSIESIYSHMQDFMDHYETQLNDSLDTLSAAIINSGCVHLRILDISRSICQAGYHRYSLTFLQYGLIHADKLPPINYEQYDRELEKHLEVLMSDNIEFDDEQAALRYTFDLMDCLMEDLILMLIRKDVRKKWCDHLFTRVIQICTPNNKKDNTSTVNFLKEKEPVAVSFLDRFASYLLSIHPYDTCNQDIITRIMDYMGMYANISPELCAKYFNAFDEILRKRLSIAASKNHRNSQANEESYFELLHRALCSFGSHALLRPQVEAKINEFLRCPTIKAETRVKIVYYYAFIRVPHQAKEYNEFQANLKRLIEYCLEQKLWPQPDFSPQCNCLRLFAGIDEMKICLNPSLGAPLLDQSLQTTVHKSMLARSPYAINRSLVLLNKHISLITSQTFRQHILKDVFDALKELNLHSPLIDLSIINCSQAIEQMFAEEKRKNKTEFYESQMKIMRDFINLLYGIINRTRLNHNDQSHSETLSRFIIRAMSLIENLEADTNFADLMCVLLPTIQGLKSNLVPETYQMLLFIYITKMDRAKKFTDPQSIDTLKLIVGQVQRLLQSDLSFACTAAVKEFLGTINDKYPQMALTNSSEDNGDNSTEELYSSGDDQE